MENDKSLGNKNNEDNRYDDNNVDKDIESNDPFAEWIIDVETGELLEDFEPEEGEDDNNVDNLGGDGESDEEGDGEPDEEGTDIPEEANESNEGGAADKSKGTGEPDKSIGFNEHKDEHVGGDDQGTDKKDIIDFAELSEPTSEMIAGFTEQLGKGIVDFDMPSMTALTTEYESQIHPGEPMSVAEAIDYQKKHYEDVEQVKKDAKFMAEQTIIAAKLAKADNADDIEKIAQTMITYNDEGIIIGTKDLSPLMSLAIFDGKAGAGYIVPNPDAKQLKPRTNTRQAQTKKPKRVDVTGNGGRQVNDDSDYDPFAVWQLDD